MITTFRIALFNAESSKVRKTVDVNTYNAAFLEDFIKAANV